MSRKSNRREFLKGRSAGEALADAIAPSADASVHSLPDAPTVHVTRRAMACEFELRFPDDPQKNLTELALETFDLLETIEEQLSFFRPTSELSRINLLAANNPVEVEPSLFDLLELALRLSRETAGAWDATAVPLWQVWGFAKRKGRIPTAAELFEARQCVGYEYVQLDAAQRTVFFTRPGVKLNFGSLGKGYALDRVAERLLAGGMTDFLLHWRAKQHHCPRERERCGRRLADRAAASAAPGGGWGKFGSAIAPGHVQFPLPVVPARGQGLWAHSRSAHGLARRGGPFRNRSRPNRGTCRRPIHGVFRHGIGDIARLLQVPRRHFRRTDSLFPL